QPVEPRRIALRIKTWQYIVIGLMVLCAVGLLVLNAWMTPYNLRIEQAAARAAGLALSEAELARQTPPASQDAAPDWLALREYLDDHPLDTSAVDAATVHRSRLPDAAVPAVRLLLSERSDVMYRIH